MSPAMVERLFWRAGFGPTAEDRALWPGRPVQEAVDHLLSKPATLAGPAPERDGNPLDPAADDTDLVLWWIDQMVRSTNPLVERLCFMWHNHTANSRDAVSPPQLLMKQLELFRRYSDFGTNPDANFRQMTKDMTADPAMLRFLTGESNLKGSPNENYARELMELFCLGIFDASGSPNYSESDIKQMAKALSGWTIDDSDPDNATSSFDQNRWFDGPKSFLGVFKNFKMEDTVDLVIDQPAHARFLILKIWHEFIVSPPDDATLNDCIKTYLNGGHKLKPVLRKILAHRLLFESIGEPNMLKPPIVYVVGVMRALGLSITDSTPIDYLGDMGQVPLFPPTVAGWEGGLTWLNTNTALARFDFVGELLDQAEIDDVSGETGAAAYDRAYAAAAAPWLAPGTRQAIRDYANQAKSRSANDRKQRQLMTRALMLAGPDAQVM
jgi:uncharacterized protein (DUF1800 family)